MEIKEGYVYHIKNQYFDFVKDDKLMKNHEGKSTRPNYFCVKLNDDKILWFILMSSKVEKYQNILNDKIKKYKKCDTIIIGNYRGRDHAFLLQNMFPITSKYIDHIDTVNGKALQVPSETRRQILDKLQHLFKLKEKRNQLNFS
ncbi:MAG: type III toxin-antitoxin system ToxN/AbiQ family toxin [Clostridia bacterium]|nr:type III toxin-antitoxin system ToxN/AbiQ family toxin [Clostridia bacterium]